MKERDREIGNGGRGYIVIETSRERRERLLNIRSVGALYTQLGAERSKIHTYTLVIECSYFLSLSVSLVLNSLWCSLSLIFSISP
jgi:hypothetical protein